MKKFGKKMSLQDKVNSNLGKWKCHRLKAADKEKYRFRVTVLFEKVLSYQVKIDDLALWVPKSVCEIGIEPGGQYYAIDLPAWFVSKNNLL